MVPFDQVLLDTHRYTDGRLDAAFDRALDTVTEDDVFDLLKERNMEDCVEAYLAMEQALPALKDAAEVFPDLERLSLFAAGARIRIATLSEQKAWERLEELKEAD